MLPILGIIGDLIDKALSFIPNPEERAKAAEALQASTQLAAQQIQLAQIATNTEEAKNPSMFIGGARPFIMWVCGAALAYQYLGRPLIGVVLSVFHRTDVIMIGLDDNLWQLMTGMLGLAGWRSYDKMNGVETKQLSTPPLTQMTGK